MNISHFTRVLTLADTNSFYSSESFGSELPGFRLQTTLSLGGQINTWSVKILFVYAFPPCGLVKWISLP